MGRRQTGNETYVVNLARALDERSDVEPLIFVDHGAEWPGQDPDRLVRLRIPTPFLRIPFELPARASRSRAQLIHVQYVSPPVSRLPVVTAIHDLSFEDVPGLFPRRTELRLRTFVRWSARRSAAVVAISQFTRRRLVDRYGLDPDRVVVTPLAAGPQWTPLAANVRSERLRGARLPAQFVLAVGNLHPRKNIARLIKSVAAARARGLGDIHLVLAGQRGWRAEAVDEAIASVDGSTWVRPLGYVSDDLLQALYGEALVVAYPSLYEGFGLPVIEALACGAVVLAADATAIPEVVGDAGVLVDPSDTEAITDGLIRAAADTALRARLMRDGPVQAARFTWDRCAEATVAAYRIAVSS